MSTFAERRAAVERGAERVVRQLDDDGLSALSSVMLSSLGKRALAKAADAEIARRLAARSIR